MNNPWFIHFSRSQRSRLRLFCFPYAGGNAHIFRAWAAQLPPWVDVIGVQSPGKGSRALERPCTTVSEMTGKLMQALEPMLHDKPFAFFGHSNGALISFELSCMLQERELPLPRTLLLSANPAPWTREFDEPYSAMSDEAFKNALQDLNGTPQEILANRELLDLFLPGLRADFSLSETYVYARARKLSVPTSVFYGEHDEIEEHQIHAWQEEIEPPIRFERLPGGHFFIHSHLDQLTALVSRQLQEFDGSASRRLESVA